MTTERIPLQVGDLVKCRDNIFYLGETTFGIVIDEYWDKSTGYDLESGKSTSKPYQVVTVYFQSGNELEVPAYTLDLIQRD